MRAKGLAVEGIQSIMGDGIICGIAGVDREGHAITPYINYLDSRTARDVQAINAMNLDIWGKETGNAEANCMFPAMFARWFLENSKAFQEKGAKFIHNAPYILAHLAGLSAEEMLSLIHILTFAIALYFMAGTSVRHGQNPIVNGAVCRIFAENMVLSEMIQGG